MKQTTLNKLTNAQLVELAMENLKAYSHVLSDDLEDLTAILEISDDPNWLHTCMRTLKNITYKMMSAAREHQPFHHWKAHKTFGEPCAALMAAVFARVSAYLEVGQVCDQVDCTHQSTFANVRNILVSMIGSTSKYDESTLYELMRRMVETIEIAYTALKEVSLSEPESPIDAWQINAANYMVEYLDEYLTYIKTYLTAVIDTMHKYDSSVQESCPQASVMRFVCPAILIAYSGMYCLLKEWRDLTVTEYAKYNNMGKMFSLLDTLDFPIRYATAHVIDSWNELDKGWF